MPTYQYRCTNCGNDLEAKQSFTDAPLADCPACGESSLRKQFGSVGVVFKGSGFYRTDSRNGSGTDTAKTDSGDKKSKSSGSSDSAKSSTTSETKKSETKKADKPAAAAKK